VLILLEKLVLEPTVDTHCGAVFCRHE
jgi:hypothetical protein